MQKIIFSDRDGTINKDDEGYLGRKATWKDQVCFIDGVVEGIKLINSIPKSKFFIVTQQSGVALSGDDFDELTEERMCEVNKYIINKLQEEQAIVDGCFSCPYVNESYVEISKRRGREVNPDFVKEGHEDIKPKPGMILKALASLGISEEEAELYVIGDRASDVQTAVNVGGTGILIESNSSGSVSTSDEVKKVRNMQGKVFIVKNFLEAAEYITQQKM